MPMSSNTTTMHDKEPSMMNSMNMMMTGKNSDKPVTMQTELRSVVDYQTAQALAIQVQEIFNKNLKPIAPMNLTNANIELEKDLNQLKNAIDTRAPVMDIMNIVHGQIHPLMMTTYNLQLKR